MIKTLSILSILIFLTACNKDKQVTIDWGDGRKEIKYYVDKRDTLNYVREFYYSNGQLGTIGRFVNGEMDSTWIWYYPNGKIQDLAFLKEGLYINERRHWYSNGSLKSVEFIDVPCDHDCCDGQVLYYDSLGVLKQKVTIGKGLVQDTFLQYWNDGSIFIKALYKDDKHHGFYNEFHPNSKKWVVGQFLEDKKVGGWEWYDTSGVLVKRNYFEKKVNR